MSATQFQFYQQRGWCTFPCDPVLSDWIAASLPAIRASIVSPEHQQWLRYGGTWYAGVNALDNDATGAVPGGPPLTGAAVDFIRKYLPFPPVDWDRAQVSVCYPGYPQPMAGESDAVFAFRRDRDAAHVDGLRRQEPGRRRFLEEYHGFILGIPVTDHPPDAAPFTVWEGSHRLIGDWFRRELQGHPPETWPQIDLTESYHAARQEVFQTCRRVVVTAKPGEAYIAHRHVLHGMAPWPAPVGSAGERAILYFRPPVPVDARWLGML